MIDYGIHCFLAVAQEKNFTRAAKHVSRTQSAVTQQINKLEQMLGKQLFHRGKVVTLTTDGEIFLPYAQKIFKLCREVTDRFTDPELEGEISFGVPEDFATMFLSDILFDFSRIHPRILLNVDCDLTVNLFERFKKGKLDMVIVKMAQPEDFPYGVEIWSEALQWVGTTQMIDSLTENNPLPLVLSPEPCIYRTQAIDMLEKAGIPWKIVFNSSSYVGTIAAVKAGMGMTVLPRMLVPSTLKKINEPLLPLLPDIHVSLLKKTSEVPSIQTLETFLLEKLGRTPISSMKEPISI